MKWKVVVGSTGVPSAFKTKPPLATVLDTQSPTPLVGVLAKRSPSMAKPPKGGLTGASPFGGAGQGLASVKATLAVKPDNSPVAVAKKPCPRKLAWTRR